MKETKSYWHRYTAYSMGLYFVCFHFPNLVKGEVLLYCNVKGSGLSVPTQSILLLLHCLFAYLLFILNKHWFTPVFLFIMFLFI